MQVSQLASADRQSSRY